MNAISKTSKIALITMVLAAAATGCNRQSPDANQSSSAAGTTGSTSSDTGTTTGSLASRSGTTDNADASRSASTDTSGSSSAGSYGTSSDTAGSSSSGGTTTAPGTSGTGTTVGTAIDDSVITTKVKSALLGDSDIKSLDISVKTDKGEVMLSGFVKNQAQIDRAVKLASSVEGVKGVQSKMSVKG